MMFSFTSLSGAERRFEFVENLGQWESSFMYRCYIPGGELFVSTDKITFHFWDQTRMNELTEAMHEKKGNEISNTIVQHHVLTMRFVGANPQVKAFGEDPSSHYFNYFLGNDPGKWKSEVRSYARITLQNIYPGIDFVMYTHNDQLKYEYVVKPGVSPSQIQTEYLGFDRLFLRNNALVIQTSLGELTEQAPFIYQQNATGQRDTVSGFFKLKNNRVSYAFPHGYNTSLPLIIDPALIFSTYSGSLSDNWGFTATYDSQGNMYGGGIVLSANAYPSITGSYQAAFGGGIYDVLIGKFNDNGTALMHYTYLGGGQAEAPFSLVCNSNDELYVLGVTGSSNFAVTPGAYQTTFKGGQSVGIFALNGNDYPNGTDLFVTKFNPAGTVLIGSTFIGGTDNDGINTSSTLRHNYADEFRGEIIVGPNDNSYVVSCSKSIDFPIVGGPQTTLAGSQDAVIFRLSPNLTALGWSTYLGGNGYEAGYSLKVNNSGEIYVTGGTNSSNFPTTAGVIKPSFGGNVDGFITRYSPSGNIIMNSTFIGTTAYDQCYILQLDGNQNIYVVGQTRGAYPIVSSILGPAFTIPNSGQFIHKLTPNLSTTVFSTVFGRGLAGQIDIVPTALLVDICDHIYVSGWGGSVNNGYGGGSTSGMPITANAYKATTDGSDFYFIVLDEDATGLIYASYFGGPVSAEHVDGGTSRFNPDGIVYQAVCAGCGNNNDFPTSAGAWSSTNNSNNCNMGVFKFDVSEFTAIIDPVTPTITCINNTVILQNASTGGSSYFWDFGDGHTAQTPIVNHAYANPGTYTVMLIVSDPNSCLQSDTATLVVVVEAPPNAQINPVSALCPGESVQLQASGGLNYIWAPSSSLSNTQISNPVASPASTSTYTVTVSNNCGANTATITVPVIIFNPTISSPDTICIGQSAQLTASGGNTYAWSPTIGLSNPNIANPIATPNNTTTYTVIITDANGCSATRSTSVTVETAPMAQAGPDIHVCFGNQITLNGSGGTSFYWQPSTYLNNPQSATPVCTPMQDITYVLTASNSCGNSYDTIQVYVVRVNPQAGPDTTICPNTSVMLWATGGETYSWQPAALINNPHLDTIIVSPSQHTIFTVTVTDSFGCTATDSVHVQVFPTQYINLGANKLIPFGGSVQLIAQGNGSFSWAPDSFLTCTQCYNPVASPFSSTHYFATLTDANGCHFYDSIWVFVEGSLYVPNTFTPNRDGINDFFFAFGTEIKTFEMMVFNRWGEEIFKTDDISIGWDGTHRGQKSPIGVYAWRILYTENSGKEGTLIGHVTLLR